MKFSLFNQFKNTYSIVLLLSTVMIIGGCKKKVDIEKEPTVSTNFTFRPDYPIPSDADCYFVAIYGSVELKSSEGYFETRFGMGLANLNGNFEPNKLKLQNKVLPYKDGEYYYDLDFNKSGPNIIGLGIDLDAQMTWEMDDPYIYQYYDRPTFVGVNGFTLDNIKSRASIVREDGYTINNNICVGADSVIYTIYSSDDKFVSVTKKRTNTEVVFTPEQLAELDETNEGVIQLTSFQLNSEFVMGKKCYFISETVLVYPNMKIK